MHYLWLKTYSLDNTRNCLYDCRWLLCGSLFIVKAALVNSRNIFLKWKVFLFTFAIEFFLSPSYFIFSLLLSFSSSLKKDIYCKDTTNEWTLHYSIFYHTFSQLHFFEWLNTTFSDNVVTNTYNHISIFLWLKLLST